jgi:hypothetical protein
MEDIASAIRLKIVPYCERIELMVNTLVEIYTRCVKTHPKKNHLFPGSSFDAALQLQSKMSSVKGMFVTIYENIAMHEGQRTRITPAEVESTRSEFAQLCMLLKVSPSSKREGEEPEDDLQNVFFACLKYSDVEFALFVSSVAHDNNIPQVIQDKDDFRAFDISIIRYCGFPEPLKESGVTHKIEARLSKLIKDIEFNLLLTDKQRSSRLFSSYKQIVDTPKKQFYEKRYVLNYLFFNFYRHIASSIKHSAKFTPEFIFLFNWD